MKKGFTLAEVLITLGIIGVVAALTIPSLIANYQKQVWVNQLKKTVSVLENGFKKAMADDGVDKLYNTELWSYLPNTGASCTSYFYCATFLDNLSKYFNLTIDKKSTPPSRSFSNLNNNSTVWSYPTIITFTDGAQIGFNTIYKSTTSVGFIPLGGYGLTCFILDVNGEKKPNKLGRDVFAFVLTDDGLVTPFGSRAVISKWCRDTGCGNSGNEQCIQNCTNAYVWDVGTNSCTESGNGFGCAGRIIEKGWKMDY